jgi:pimeloyl-ACP methyl ester carboxylesterase
MPDFAHDGANIHYEEIGSGSPLMLIPGIGSDGASWHLAIALLAERHRVIVITNRGAGQTRYEGAITISDMIGDCLALLDHLGVARANVVGHSLGGMIALRFAAAHPRRVQRLVTVTATPALTLKQALLLEEQARLCHELTPERWFAQFFQWMRSDAFFSDRSKVAAAAEAAAAYPHRQSPADFARQVAALETLGTFDTATIACPVLAIAAELDIFFPAEGVMAAHRSIDDHQFEVIAGAAHSVAVEAPEQVAKSILQFLA